MNFPKNKNIEFKIGIQGFNGFSLEKVNGMQINKSNKDPENISNFFDTIEQGDMTNLLLLLPESKEEKKKLVNTISLDDGLSALHRACDRGYLQIVKLLIEECDADINIPDNVSGMTPLQFAIECEHLDIIKYLQK